MDSRWSYFVLALALIQGTLALNPIPEDLDHDWEAFRQLMRDVAYRLPTTTVPRHYEVNLTPYFEDVPEGIQPFTFEGSVVVYISATEANVNEIVMHCNDLNVTSITVSTILNGIEMFVDYIPTDEIPECHPLYSFLNINLTQTLNLDQEYIVRMSFTGNIQSSMRGFYRSWYYDQTGKRWMGTTQFQPGHARQAFPCYDEPGFKATFDITINREQDFSPTISNMPIRTTTNLANGRVAETFYTTPKTSTYLLAFIVSHYDKIAESSDPLRPFDIYARDNAGSTGDWALEIGVKLLEEIEEFTNYSYYGMAENLNMKQAAIPDFSAGAMENWGLLTYREALILYDPVNSNHFYRQRVANIVSHEITHMYFGNLVTCAWWDSLWLNEGFARLYQYFLTSAVAPELGYETRFITEQLQSAMLSDSVDSAHQLTNPDVNDPTSVSAHFSTITYAKGAAVIRMTRHFVGNSTYQKALRNYLVDRQFDVASPEDLFNAFDAAAAEDNALSAYPGVTISDYFKTWSDQAGHPLLTVNVDHSTGLMTVVQARWERTTGQSSFIQTWMIPVTWTRGGAPEFYDLKPSQVITQQVTVINRGTTGLEWVIFNKQESGFYRINYDDTTWDLITEALKGSERTLIHELSRAQIVDDVFQLARAGVLPYTKALSILSFLEFEDAYGPWDAAITGFNWLIRRVVHDSESYELLRNEILRLSTGVKAKLGYVEPGGETYMDELQRMYIMQFLCNLGDDGCVAAGRTSFQNLVNSNTFVPANMRPWVYCVGLREGDSSSFDYLWNRFVNEDLAGEQVVMLTALGCTRDTSSIYAYLDHIVTENDYVREQDFTTALNGAVIGNEQNTLIVFEWLKNNVQEVTNAFGSVATPLSYIAARLLNEDQIAEFQSWLDANQDIIGTSAYNTGVSGIASVRTTLQWSENRVPEIIEYLTTDDTTTTTATPPGAEGSPDAEAVTDSASKSVLSIIFMLITLSINLLVCW